MFVFRVHGVGSREVQLRVRYFQAVFWTIADHVEVGRVPVVVGLQSEDDTPEINRTNNWLFAD